MNLIQSIFLGLVQGLTEFLPVSSSGHLAIFKNIFHMNTDSGLLFDVLLHLGTLLAICVVYWDDVRQLFVEGVSILCGWLYNAWVFLHNRFSGNKKKYRHVITNSYRRFVLLILVSSIPTAVIGLLLKDIIESASDILIIPGICLIVTGILLFVLDRMPEGGKSEVSASYRDAFFVGTVQGIATLPGISRSGSTIFACRKSGFQKEFAIKYSFIMSIPAVMGSALLELHDASAFAIRMTDLLCYIVGMAVAAVSGYICIKTMLMIVRNNKFRYFAYYCVAVGVITSICYFVL